MGLLTPLAIRIGSIGWLPRLLPQIVWTDRLLLRVTRGRVSLLDLAGLPNLVLTVRGRRTGIPRSTPLLCVPYGDSWLIAGSNFGGPTQPLWVGNLEATGTAQIRVGGTSHSVVARRLDPDERAIVWPHLLDTWPNYAKYQQRTDRVIKVFELSAAG